MNKVILVGIIKNIEFSHECHGESFSNGIIEIPRLSGVVDSLPVVISDLIAPASDTKVKIIGEFRSRNIDNRCILYIFAQEVYKAGEDETVCNEITIESYICKPVVKRTTPKGKAIADVIVACNRLNGKPDYIPCIFWGRIAFIAANHEVGDHVMISGRIQSREYAKALADGTTESKVAYEVSAFNILDIEESEVIE